MFVVFKELNYFLRLLVGIRSLGAFSHEPWLPSIGCYSTCNFTDSSIVLTLNIPKHNQLNIPKKQIEHTHFTIFLILQPSMVILTKELPILNSTITGN
jgi:hypothetical protein